MITVENETAQSSHSQMFAIQKLSPYRIPKRKKVGLDIGMFTLRAAARENVESVAFQEPCTIAEIRSGMLIPWQRTEGDYTIRRSCINGSMEIDRRSFVFGGA